MKISQVDAILIKSARRQLSEFSDNCGKRGSIDSWVNNSIVCNKSCTCSFLNQKIAL